MRSCHIVVGDQSLPESERVMRAVEERLGADFGIGHTTIQVETAHRVMKRRST